MLLADHLPLAVAALTEKRLKPSLGTYSTSIMVLGVTFWSTFRMTLMLLMPRASHWEFPIPGERKKRITIKKSRERKKNYTWQTISACINWFECCEEASLIMWLEATESLRKVRMFLGCKVDSDMRALDELDALPIPLPLPLFFEVGQFGG